jgi:hypothetical protein
LEALIGVEIHRNSAVSKKHLFNGIVLMFLRLMKLRWLLHIALLVSLLVSTVCLPVANVYYHNALNLSNEEFFFGVSFGGNTANEAKLLIDKVKGYTNFFLVNNWDISTNETALTEICEYAVNANMYVMVYFDFIYYNVTGNIGSFYNATTWDVFGIIPWHIAWLNNAREKWGDKFLGVYLYDEPGGNQIDRGYWGGNNVTRSGRPISTFANVSDYSDAANRFVTSISRSRSMQLLTNTSLPDAINSKMPLFTSDYALYWFDYLAGYDTVFVELGWNNSRTQQIALCRGAANMQEKQWGAMITWTYSDPPYLASGSEVLQDMFTAYRAGAKYVIVFDYPKYPETNPYGILTEEHFTAMKEFWNYVHAYPRDIAERVDGQVALVLPKDYGWGMRRTQYITEDRIWGFWPEDEKMQLIGENMNRLIEKYGLKLDIIYDDSQFNFTEKYSQIYFWNSTIDLSTESVPGTPPYELYVALVIPAIAIICVPSYLIMRRRKQRPAKAVFPVSAAKARLRNFGNGKLELTDNTIKFYIGKGRLKKRREIAREIPITDIESVKQVGNELTITWKETTDTFVIEKMELVEKINERVTETMKEQKKVSEDKETANQKRNELTGILSVAVEIVDSSFDILRSLQGRVDWNRVEGYLKRSEENVRSLAGQKIGTINLEFTRLSLTVKEHLPEEISKETYSILRSLYEYFSGLTSKNELLEQIHPNYQDTKTTIIAYYTLNDIILGTIVGDQEIGKESNELVMMLDDLSKGTDLKINVDAIKDVINKLGMEKGKESVIEESRAVFIQQLKELITA